MSISVQPADPRGPRSAKAALKPCGYIGTGGIPCKFKTLPGHRYCFWHEVSAPKDGPMVGQMVSRFVHEDQDLEGFQLAGANLERRQLQGAHLVKANLEGARLYRANLDGAHLFGANLKDANLYYTSLADANLRSTSLSGANLLGAKIGGARFDGADLGKHSVVVNEHKANREAQQGDHVEARKFWLESEEVYLTLLNNFRDAGRNDEASEMFYRMMVVKRKLSPKYSLGRFGSLFMDIVCGYGERPLRIIASYLGFVVIYAIIYFMLGIKNAVTGDAVVFSAAASLADNLWNFACTFYFSMVIITTTGYGDFLPVDSTRWFAATEAFLGSFFMAVFILVFTRKMMR